MEHIRKNSWSMIRRSQSRGAATEAQNNQWEYYCNEIHEMDNFVKELTDALADYPEDVILVMYGDHLPTMGLTVEDLKNKYLFQTEYVMWDNFGMEKRRWISQLIRWQSRGYGSRRNTWRNNLPLSPGRRNTGSYQVILETLQYDLLYGESMHTKIRNWHLKEPKCEWAFMMWVWFWQDLSYSDIDFKYRLKGTNFTPSSQVKLNGEWIDTRICESDHTDDIRTELKDFDRISVSQRSNSSTRKALSKELRSFGLYVVFLKNKLETSDRWILIPTNKRLRLVLDIFHHHHIMIS